MTRLPASALIVGLLVIASAGGVADQARKTSALPISSGSPAASEPAQFVVPPTDDAQRVAAATDVFVGRVEATAVHELPMSDHRALSVDLA